MSTSITLNSDIGKVYYNGTSVPGVYFNGHLIWEESESGSNRRRWKIIRAEDINMLTSGTIVMIGYVDVENSIFYPFYHRGTDEAPISEGDGVVFSSDSDLFYLDIKEGNERLYFELGVDWDDSNINFHFFSATSYDNGETWDPTGGNIYTIDTSNGVRVGDADEPFTVEWPSNITTEPTDYEYFLLGRNNSRYLVHYNYDHSLLCTHSLLPTYRSAPPVYLAKLLEDGEET